MVIGDKSAVSCDCVKLCNLYFIGQFFKIILDFLLFENTKNVTNKTYKNDDKTMKS
jgi:hypothetical protein